MPAPLPLNSLARLADPADNVAIAIQQIEPGTAIVIDGTERRFAHTVLLGHRFAVRPIAAGEELLSWGRPFGVALEAIAPGDYICNAQILEALTYRNTGALLPEKPNFASRIVRYAFDEAAFQPSPPVDRVEKPATFLGYRRSGGRGVGTRNTIVILGTSSRTAGFARQLAAQLQPLARLHPSLDGIVALAHTEGGDPSEPNNMEELLRALAGFVVHPNVGAILAVDYGAEPLNNARLEEYLERHRYPHAHVPHHFLTIHSTTSAALAEGEAQIKAWLPSVAGIRRTEESMAGLCVALQCGGSDAFSGISGNPLVGAVSHEVVRHGGRVCLTETDELIGAEGHVLGRVRDLETARRFLESVERFKTRLGWHGASAEGNPSGGNKLRGLYNITLKSLGAAAKKSPLTRLDFVTRYAERILEPGFTFMDGPGNDLEGIAGQAAAGCNLFLFVTGNGSVTNFPFAPTIKVTTTTERHELLHNEMDVNAGRYLDGEPMDVLRDETFELVRSVASGQRTQGERAGHSQVSLWRNWRQTDGSSVATIRARPQPDGRPLKLDARATAGHASVPPPLFPVYRTPDGFALERIGLVLPASLCSGQVARMAAARLNEHHASRSGGISRYVALVHTEGCGFSGDSMYQLLLRTYQGYLTHRCVAAALVLEHGCEKIPNDLVRQKLVLAGVDPQRFGWASVQLDGGIEKVLARIDEWFTAKTADAAFRPKEMAGLETIWLGLLSSGSLSPGTAGGFARLVRQVVEAGGSVLLPRSDPLLATAEFSQLLHPTETLRPTLLYGEAATRPGLHVVETESEHVVENIAGLGGCGAQILLCAVGEHPSQGHPMLPVLQVAEGGPRGRLTTDDIDLFLPAGSGEVNGALLRLIVETIEGTHVPRAMAAGLIDFQLTRGLLGVTT